MWAVTGIRTAPRPVGANCVQAQPAASYDGGGFLWEVGTSYNERRFLWEAVRFVQAVSCVRRIPRRRRELRAGSACGAEEGAGSACRAGQPAFMRAYRIRGARRFLWEVIQSIISGGFYGKSVRFVWAVTGMRRPPRPPYWRGAAWVQAQPAAPTASAACGDSMGSGAFYRAAASMGSDTL